MESKKELEYASKIMLALADVFDNEENDFYINLRSEEIDLTALTYAMGTMAPCLLFNKITGNDKNHLEFNHMQNHLCFQFTEKVD